VDRASPAGDHRAPAAAPVRPSMSILFVIIVVILVLILVGVIR
jgi:hypothetical protein